MLLTAHSAQAYFREALDAALRQCHVNATESAQAYVVYLLNEFSRSENAFAGTNYGEQPNMAQLFERAQSAEDLEALKIYRHLGDSCLYILGFFKEFAVQRIVSESYYRDMGAHAYSHAASLARIYAGPSAATFQELSDKFNDFALLLETIAHYNGPNN